MHAIATASGKTNSLAVADTAERYDEEVHVG